MSLFDREIEYLLLQLLYEGNIKETYRKLEQETGLFLSMRHFADMVTNGAWEEPEKYLCDFMKLDDNRSSTKIFFEIRKQKYLEALDNQDRAKAVDILVKDVKIFDNRKSSLS